MAYDHEEQEQVEQRALRDITFGMDQIRALCPTRFAAYAALHAAKKETLRVFAIRARVSNLLHG